MGRYARGKKGERGGERGKSRWILLMGLGLERWEMGLGGGFLVGGIGRTSRERDRNINPLPNPQTPTFIAFPPKWDGGETPWGEVWVF